MELHGWRSYRISVNEHLKLNIDTRRRSQHIQISRRKAHKPTLKATGSDGVSQTSETRFQGSFTCPDDARLLSYKLHLITSHHFYVYTAKVHYNLHVERRSSPNDRPCQVRVVFIFITLRRISHC